MQRADLACDRVNGFRRLPRSVAVEKPTTGPCPATRFIPRKSKYWSARTPPQFVCPVMMLAAIWSPTASGRSLLRWSWYLEALVSPV